MPEPSDTWHDNAIMRRYRIPSARRSRTLPEDSVFYRPILDVPKYERSDEVIAWCNAVWPRPYLRADAVSWKNHDNKSAAPNNGSIPSPGYYLDATNVPSPPPRTVYLSLDRRGRTTESGNSEATSFSHRFPQANSSRHQLRVQAGVAGHNPPFHPVGGDRHSLLVWNAERFCTETIDTAHIWNGSSWNVQVGGFTKRPFDDNDWKWFAHGSLAGSNGGRVPASTLVLTWDELKRGWINHTMMLVVDSYSSQGPGGPFIGARWPCGYTDGEDRWATTDTPDGPGSALRAGGPFAGHIFRLRQDYPIHIHENPLTRTLLRGLREFGMILMDKSGPTGETSSGDLSGRQPMSLVVANDARFGDTRWTTVLPDTIDGIPQEPYPDETIRVTDFEIVDIDPSPILNDCDFEGSGIRPSGAQNIKVADNSWACYPPGYSG